MNKNTYDLIIIGAGAAGGSLAYESTKRGLKVLLIDAGDFGGGTSSKSTKLLHGGVRYLELAFKKLDLSQIKLVREALTERQYWINQVPFLAKNLDIIIPTNNILEQNYYKLGLNFYDKLSGKSKLKNSFSINNQKIFESFPLLIRKTYGGVNYTDGQFNDSRLNLLLSLSAERQGAKIKNYCTLIQFETNSKGKINAAITEDKDGKIEKWESNLFVNATGIKSDLIRDLSTKNIDKRIIISRGSHIVLNKKLCKQNKGLLIPKTSDGRVLFLLPLLEYTLVGTTDIKCNIKAAFTPTKEEKSYLLNYTKKYFSDITENDISSFWAGGRPLLKPQGNSKTTMAYVREHDIEVLDNGLISIMGGKWTTCRRMALDTLKEIEKIMGKKLKITSNKGIIGSKGDCKNTMFFLNKEKSELKNYLPNQENIYKQISHLQSNYGLNTKNVIKGASIDELKPLSKIIPFCEAEIKYAIKSEHAQTAMDILERRNRLSLIDFNEAEKIKPFIENTLIRYKAKMTE